MGTFLPYGRQWINDDDIHSVVEVLRGDWITQGPKIQEFEEKLASYCGARFAVACANGTAALHLACLASGLGEGDELVTSAISFLASANCALYVGAIPRFADIDFATMRMAAASLVRRLNEKTRALVPVHFAGLSCDMKEIAGMVDREKVTIIEDACHALGGEYRGKKVGCCEYSDMAIFSFHPVKHLTTGEGGIIVTNREDLYQRLLSFRNHGMTKDPRYLEKQDGPWYYEMHRLGYNYRITDLQCALGISQLNRLDEFVQRRRELAHRYNQEFGEEQHCTIPIESEEARSSWHIYPLRIEFDDIGKSRKLVVEELRKRGIGTQVHYYPIPMQPYYRAKWGYTEKDFPEAVKHYSQALTLPLFPAMSDKDVELVISSVREVFHR